MNNMNQMMGNMNMNMNQAGMSSTLMTNFAMDDTAMKIKAIIDPYEKKIIDLEKIIRQKDFEILVLKEKLNNYKNFQMNINNNQMGMNNNNQMNMGNQMGMGMNNNQIGMNMGNQMDMGINMNMGNQIGMNMGNDMNMNMMNQNMMNNQMPPMMNPMMMNNKPMWMWHYNNLNDNQNLNDENNSSNKINIIFKSDNSSSILIICDFTEKISEVIKRYFIKAGIDSKYHKYFKFIYNAKNINMDLTVAESGIANNSNIFVIKIQNVMIPRNDINTNSEQKKENEEEKRINIRFNTTQGTTTSISFNENGSIGDLIKLYLKTVDRPDLISSLMNGDKSIAFLWNANKLDINDTKKAKDFFKGVNIPRIVVNDINNSIGA